MTTFETRRAVAACTGRGPKLQELQNVHALPIRGFSAGSLFFMSSILKSSEMGCGGWRQLSHDESTGGRKVARVHQVN